MVNQWILLADGSRARLLYLRNRVAPMEEIADFVHAASRMRDPDLATDEPGRVRDRHGSGRHAMAEPNQVKDQEKQRFARELAERLRQGRVEGRYDGLVLIAPPQFLGELREALDAATAERITHSFDKDLVGADEATLRRLLDLPPPKRPEA